ncbi:MAG: phosphatase [Clostridiales bacterium]|nr:phosphatase [Clostridiales bacterium]
MKDILDLHTHTLASGHAYSTINEMAQEAANKGIKLLGITEHAPKMPGTCHLYYFENLHVVPRQMYGVQLLFGSEVNILDYEGNLDLEDRVMKKLDLCIASIHPPCFTAGTKEENTNAIINTMKNPYISIIGHPDDGRFELDYEKVVKAAKEYSVMLEINNASVSPGSFRPNTRENDLLMLSYCKQYQVPVIMGSDAHVAFDLGKHDAAWSVIQEAKFPEDLVMNSQPEKVLEMIRARRNNQNKN